MAGLVIDILCRDGSPLGVSMSSLWGEDQTGVGGSEYALLTLCEEWQKAGHHVRLYNDPRNPQSSPFEQLATGEFHPPDKRDVLINFRSPNEKAIVAYGLKVWLSCDQYTIDSFKDFAPYMDKIVCISPFHQRYFKEQYGIENTLSIDLPVRVHDLDGMEVEKVKNRLIFTSVPDRGLPYLREAWDIVKKEIPDASLVITSDFRLWGLDMPLNEKFRVPWIGCEDVWFAGAIKRQKLLEEQLKADLFTYPCVYDELFCVSLAEAQVCGAYPITSELGALKTTSLGTLISGDPRDPRSGFVKRFSDAIIEELSNHDVLASKQQNIKEEALERFHPDNILTQWQTEVFE